MVRVVELPPLYDAKGELDPWFVQVGLDADPSPADLVRLWRIVLATAVQDGAASIHYHPWRTDFDLSYVVGGTRFGMVPPPDGAGVGFVAAAAALLQRPWVRVARRLVGRPPQATGRVRLVGTGEPSDWAGVVWSTGGVAGVEWYRLGGVPQIPQPTAAGA